MSPYIRSMLEDAADDSGRPVRTDVQQIRSAGRRAVWRRRGLVGAGGLGVVAVVTSVALVLPSISGTPGGPAGPGGESAESTNSGSGQSAEAWGLGPAMDPLLEAITAAGYEVGGDGSLGIGGVSMGSVGEASSDGAGTTTEMSMTTTGVSVMKSEGVGALVVAEFTDVVMLNSAVGEPAPAQQCAIAPSEMGGSNAGFTWNSCEQQTSGDIEVWRAAGSGLDGEAAAGVTAVRGDGSGLSVTLSTAAYAIAYKSAPNEGSGTSWFGYGPLPPTVVAVPPPGGEAVPRSTVEDEPPPGESPGHGHVNAVPAPPVEEVSSVEQPPLEELELPPALTELPLTLDALADIVASIALSGSVFPTEEPLPVPVKDPDAREACLDGEVLAEMSDDAGRSALVQADDRIFACSWGVEPDELVDVMDVTDWPPFGDVLEAWQFNLGYLTMCERFGADGQLQLCPDDVRMGVGPVPDGVARISFELPDGEVVDAQIAAGLWLFRTVQPPESPLDDAPILVRVYGADGAVLAEGGINEHPPMATEWAEPPPGPPPGPPLESPTEPVPDDEGTAKP